ncbi:PGF-pre-PGF domain-containing protein [Candidatus Woesearchaeota archaeon]|nr:PGF-pre-PGF domain-containing protein [Candidatus Woesearchaeota archaeon]
MIQKNKNGQLKLIAISVAILLVTMALIYAAVTNQASYVTPSFANVSDTVSATVTWDGGDSLALYVCEDASCSSCSYATDTECLCHDTSAAVGSSSCDIEVQDSWGSSFTYYYTLYNSTGGKLAGPSMGAAITINQRPYATDTYILPTGANATNTLSCNYTYYDPDSDTETTGDANYIWYHRSNTGSAWTTYTGCDATIADSDSCGINFDMNHEIMCAVAVTDEHFLNSSTHLNSSPIVIGGNHVPNIISFVNTTYSNLTNRINVGDTLQIDLQWNDSVDLNEQVHAVMCNLTGITAGGCAAAARLMENTSLTTSSSITINYIVTDYDLTNQDYFVAVCDDEGECSDEVTTSYYVNHYPTITEAELKGDRTDSTNTTTDSANLFCNVSGLIDKDSVPPYLDNADNITFWQLNRSGVVTTYYAPNEAMMTHGNTLVRDQWRCIIQTYDNHSGGSYNIQNYTSNWLLISSDFGEGRQPNITGIWDSSTKDHPTNVGDQVEFKISWLDADSTEFSVYICNTSSIQSTGCEQYIFNESRDVTKTESGEVNVSFYHTMTDSFINDPNTNETGYWVTVCDHTGGIGGDWLCSNYFPWGDTNTPMGNVSINHPPHMTLVNLTAENGSIIADTNTNLYCDNLWTDTEFDYFGYGTTIIYKWYHNRTGMFQQSLPFSSQYLANGNTEINDSWICEATPYDGYTLGEPVNSSPLMVLPPYSWRVPNITLVQDSSSYTNPTNVGDYVYFNVSWSDYDSNKMIVYICNTSSIDRSGCMDGAFYQADAFSTDNPIVAQYQVKQTDNGEMNYYVKVCDDTSGIGGGQWICSDIYNISTALFNESGNISVNHLPEVYEAELVPMNTASFEDDTHLYCLANATDANATNGWDEIYDQDSISYSYKWYYNRSGTFSLYSAPSHDILTNYNTWPGDYWICEITPYDGYAYGEPINTSHTYIERSSSYGVPNILSVTDDAPSMSWPAVAGDTVNFLVRWNDTDSSNVKLYICEDTYINKTGCTNKTLYQSTGWESAQTISASYTFSESDSGTYRYSVMVCDDTGGAGGDWKCSNIFQSDADFVVKHKPNVTMLNLTGIYGNLTDRDNLVCNFTINDSDNDTEGYADVAWYRKRSGESGFSNYFSFSTSVNLTDGTENTEAYLTHGNLNAGDEWYCSVTPRDIYHTGATQTSDTVSIIAYPGPGTPKTEILSFNLVNNESNPINVGTPLPITLEWLDQDSVNVRAIACKGPNMDITGCIDESVYETGIGYYTTDNPLTFTYTPDYWDSTDQDIYFMLCDDSETVDNCSVINTTSVFVNHQPMAENVTALAYDENYVKDNLGKINSSSYIYCNFSYNPHNHTNLTFIDDSILENDNVSNAEIYYKWFIKDEGMGDYAEIDGQTSQYLSNNESYIFDHHDHIICAVSTKDKFGLHDVTYRNSSEVWINNSPPIIVANITPIYPNASQDLVCHINVTDYDQDSVNISYVWRNQNDSGIFDPPTYIDTLYASKTHVDDNVYCQLNITDGYYNVSYDSTNVTVGRITDYQEIFATESPNITWYNLNPNITYIGAMINFSANWSDSNQVRYGGTGENATMYVCNTSNIDQHGCIDGTYMYCYNYSTDAITITCSAPVPDINSTNHNYFIRVCDLDGNCSQVVTGSFVVNNRPFAQNVEVYPEDPTVFDELTCEYDYYDPDGDVEDEPSHIVIWEKFNSSSEWSQLVNYTGDDTSLKYNDTAVTHRANDTIRCTIKVFDNNTLPSSGFTPSSNRTILNTLPVILDVTSPVSGGSYSTSMLLNWSGIDYDNNTVNYSIYYSNDSGVNWHYINSTLNQTTYILNITDYNPTFYDFSIRPSDFNGSGEPYNIEGISILSCSPPQTGDWIIQGSVYCLNKEISNNIILLNGSDVIFKQLNLTGTVTIYDNTSVNISNSNITELVFRSSGNISIEDFTKESDLVATTNGLYTVSASNSYISNSKVIIEDYGTALISNSIIQQAHLHDNSFTRLESTWINKTNITEDSTLHGIENATLYRITNIGSGSGSDVKITGKINITVESFQFTSGSTLTKEIEIHPLAGQKFLIEGLDYFVLDETDSTIEQGTTGQSGIAIVNLTLDDQTFKIRLDDTNTMSVNASSDYLVEFPISSLNCTDENGWIIDTPVVCSNMKLDSNSIKLLSSMYLFNVDLVANLTINTTQSLQASNVTVSPSLYLYQGRLIGDQLTINDLKVKGNSELIGINQTQVGVIDMIQSELNISGYLKFDDVTFDVHSTIHRSFPLAFENSSERIAGAQVSVTGDAVEDQTTTDADGFADITADFTSENMYLSKNVEVDGKISGFVNLYNNTFSDKILIKYTNLDSIFNIAADYDLILEHIIGNSTVLRQTMMDGVLSASLPIRNYDIIISDSDESFRSQLRELPVNEIQYIESNVISAAEVNNPSYAIGSGQRFDVRDAVAFRTNRTGYNLIGFNESLVTSNAHIMIYRFDYNFTNKSIIWENKEEYTPLFLKIIDGYAYINITSVNTDSVYILCEDTKLGTGSSPLIMKGSSPLVMKGSSPLVMKGGTSGYIDKDDDEPDESVKITTQRKGDIVTKTYNFISLGQPLIMNLEEYGLTVRSIRIEVEETQYDVSLTFEPVPIQNVVNPYDGVVHSYYKITPTFDEIKQASIRFWLPYEWLSKQNATEDDIVLMHYNENMNEWDETFTYNTKISEGKYYFTSDLNHFSLFAIALRVKEAPEPTPPKEVTHFIQNTTIVNNTTETVIDSKTDPIYYVIIIIIMIILVLVGVLLFWEEGRILLTENSIIKNLLSKNEGDKIPDLDTKSIQKQDSKTQSMNSSQKQPNVAPSQKDAHSAQQKSSQQEKDPNKSHNNYSKEQQRMYDLMSKNPYYKHGQNGIYDKNNPTSGKYSDKVNMLTKTEKYHKLADNLVHFVKKEISKGKSKNQIRKELIDNDWPIFIIDDVMNNHFDKKTHSGKYDEKKIKLTRTEKYQKLADNLIHFVKKEISKGKSKNQIRKELIDNDWPIFIIDDVMKIDNHKIHRNPEDQITHPHKDSKNTESRKEKINLVVQEIEKYIKRNLGKKSHSSIRNSLTEAGWPPSLIDRAFSKYK